MFQAGERSPAGRVVPTGKERMAHDGHRELAGRPLERGLEPGVLRGIDRLQDAGVDREEGERAV